MTYDHTKELEKILDYESFMKECLACESVCKTKISSLEIPGLSEELSDSAEQTALTRAKATLLMKVMLERVANEQEAQKNAARQAREKKTKLMNDMSLMKQSELWKMMADDRVRSLLKSNRTRKARTKLKVKGKKKRSTLRSCTARTKTTADPWLKTRLNT